MKYGSCNHTTNMKVVCHREEKGGEICVEFEVPPPKSKDDYATLVEVKEPDPMTKKPYVILKGRYFQVRNSEGSTSWYDFHGTKAAGYEEKSFSDHVSVRSSLKIAGIIPFHADEESIYSETPAFYDGAVGPYISYIEKFRPEFEALIRK